MNQLTKLQKTLIFSAIPYTVGYLIGSFVETSFNISVWDKGTRVIIALISTIGTIGAIVACHENIK